MTSKNYSYRKLPNEVIDNIAKDYSEKKINRREIAKKYGIRKRRVDLIITQKKLTKWDMEREPRRKSRKRTNSKKYYNSKFDKSPYARMVYDFNKR